MYLKEILFKNYGVLKDVNYKFQFNSNNTPKPTVFIGRNGVGKTLLLSCIAHSLIEMKRKFYREISDVSGQNYYRLGSQNYVSAGENFSYTKIIYDDNSGYTDLMVIDYDKFKQTFNPSDYSDIDITDAEFKRNGFFTKTHKPSVNVFEQEIFLYFPVDRYYIPTWLNKENNNSKFEFTNDNFVGENYDSIITYNLLENIESWILEVVIDLILYEDNIISAKSYNANNSSPLKSVYGKNTNIVNSINKLLNEIFASKYANIRFAITQKQHGRRQIRILGTNENETECVIVPKFTNLSSGEIMLLGMMASILREYDKFSELNSMSFDAISGIVLIDEIDLHLHSDLLKTILPNLISMFPKIQFIVTSHSPFFLLGMKNKFQENCNFVTLPTGTITNQLERFDEIERCYAIVDESYKEVLDSLDKVKEKLKNISKPLIITEGKTDWKHISHALSVFHSRGEFVNLKVEFLEYEYEMGDSRLKTLLENLAKVPQSHKIIGVFDSDTNIGQNYKDFPNLSNNVYGCCIQDVHGYEGGISIELLYKREDLKRCDENGRRIYLSDEFNLTTQRLKANPQITSTNSAIVGAYRKKMIKVIDSGVFDSDNKSLALSKSDFADNVYNGKGNFADISVDGFKKIIQTIQNICDK